MRVIASLLISEKTIIGEFMDWLVGSVVFNATFNNILVISWRSALLVEDTGGPGENLRPVASHWQTLSHNALHIALIEFELTTSVVISTDFIGGESN
jgi:hypothetical protein